MALRYPSYVFMPPAIVEYARLVIVASHHYFSVCTRRVYAVVEFRSVSVHVQLILGGELSLQGADPVLPVVVKPSAFDFR